MTMEGIQSQPTKMQKIWVKNSRDGWPRMDVPVSLKTELKIGTENRKLIESLFRDHTDSPVSTLPGDYGPQGAILEAHGRVTFRKTKPERLGNRRVWEGSLPPKTRFGESTYRT